MAVRVAGREDFEEAVRLLRCARMSPLTAWALAPASDLVEAYEAHVRLAVAWTLWVGRLWLGDDGTVAGGRRLQLRLADQLRPADAAHGEIDPRTRAYRFPDVLVPCRERLRHLGTEILQLRLSGCRTFQVSIGGAPVNDAGIEPLEHLVAHARSVRHGCLVVAACTEENDGLRRAGFAPGRELAAGPDGRPAITAWQVTI